MSEEIIRRTDLFVTTAYHPSPVVEQQARAIAEELTAEYVARRDESIPKLFTLRSESVRLLVVQKDRLLLVNREGGELFYHPNMAFLRLGNLMRGGNDLLIEATGLQVGDTVLDATLGYASEAVLCAHIVGDTGEVHGIEAIPELGIVVREGLQTLHTERQPLNEAMRRVRVVHLGDHYEFLRSCPSNRYDVVCFDPFFEEVLAHSETFAPIRAFGSHGPLRPEALAEARRVACRRVVVKAVRWADTLETLQITNRIESKSGKVVYGVVSATDGD